MSRTCWLFAIIFNAPKLLVKKKPRYSKQLKTISIKNLNSCFLFYSKEPRRVRLGHRTIQRRAGVRFKEVLKDDEAMYIPLLQSLEQLLNKDSILQQVSFYHGHSSLNVCNILKAIPSFNSVMFCFKGFNWSSKK